MKRIYLFIILMFSFICGPLWYIRADVSTDSVILLKKGDVVPFDGVLYTLEESKKFTDAYLENKQLKLELKKVQTELKFVIREKSLYERLYESSQKEVLLWHNKYDSLQQEYDIVFERYEKIQKRQRALVISTSVGFSVALAEALGVAVVGLLYYSLK